jgi:8-oxo-dGTP pyrophosphatase MutT (NUDIX family)
VPVLEWHADLQEGDDVSHLRDPAPTAVACPQRLTGFACAVDVDGRILMLRHERLGVLRWELPGGHVDPGESLVDAVVREPREEALTDIEVNFAVAEGQHAWRGRTVDIVYFLARPRVHPMQHSRPDPVEDEIRSIEWVAPIALNREETSPLAWPVVDLVARSAQQPGRPLLFEATHERTDAGWEPVVTRSWQMLSRCR